MPPPSSALATSFVSLFYLSIFTFLYISHYGPSIPPLQRQYALGLNLRHAYEDLHRIAEHPHPYNSRQNDIVRHFLLERVREIAKDIDFIHVEDDVQTNAAFLDRSGAVYFEGNNILVKVHGMDDVDENDAVLFSAHFDSVSTAPGATDDGMSVVALIQMIEFLSKNRPRRTAVFNINNGEENGLHGSQTFLRHPWSNLTSTFLNFEGAGSGGRPFLFRSTSYDVLKHFRSAPHIHADVLSQDAWDRGVIRSDTDYSVYSAPRSRDVSQLSIDGSTLNATGHGYQGPGGGMQGADIAFYRSRSKYHTMEDSIGGMGDEGAMRSLWSLMELLRSVGNTILNTKTGRSTSDESERAVYFELFGIHLIAFRFQALVVTEIVLLILGPVIIAGLGYLLLRSATLSCSDFQGYGRFWLALVLGISTEAGLVVGFLKLNPNTAHGHPVATSLSAFTLAYLSLAIPLQLAQRLRPINPNKQLFAVLVDLYGFTWFLLVGATILTRRIKVAGIYWIPFWNASLLVVVTLRMSQSLWGNGRAGRLIPHRRESEGDQRTQTSEQQETEVSETTPLLLQRASQTSPLVSYEIGKEFWWIFQFIFSSTAPVLNLATIYSVWIGAMTQTIPDGGSVGIVYAPISLLSFFILLPLAPFVHKVHRSLTVFVFFFFIASTTYVWLTPPFTSDARIKVFFAQKVDLTNVTSAVSRPQLTRAITQLNVIEDYGIRLAATLPSSGFSIDDSGGKQCIANKLRRGLTTCEWPVPPALLPSIASAEDGDKGTWLVANKLRPGLTTCEWPVPLTLLPSTASAEDDDKGTWLVANVTRLGPASLHVEIEGIQTRACTISVDNRGIRRYRARTRREGGTTKFSAGAPTTWTAFEVPAEKEIHLLTLWTRAWGSKFEVEFDVDPDTEQKQKIAGRVSCLWNDGPGGAQIPALEEARGFLPEWVAISKAADGLVEAASGFLV